MNILLISLMISISSLLYSQTENCGCFNGIGATKDHKPSLNIEFTNGIRITVCGYEQKKLRDNEVLISEFNVFDCRTGESLAEYGAVQNCLVKIENEILKIIELKNLPAGKNWKWKQVSIGLQQIVVKENKLTVLGQQPQYEKTEIEKEKVELLLAELADLKGKGSLENPEEILGRLEILALNGNQKATDILTDFENYFDFRTDGHIAEQWKDAIATVEWIVVMRKR